MPKVKVNTRTDKRKADPPGGRPGGPAVAVNRIVTASAAATDRPATPATGEAVRLSGFKVKVFNHWTSLEYKDNQWMRTNQSASLEQQVNEWLTRENMVPIQSSVSSKPRTVTPTQSTLLQTLSLICMPAQDYLRMQSYIMESAIARLLPNRVASEFVKAVADAAAANEAVAVIPDGDPLAALG